MTIYYIISFLLGVGIAYVIFYLRYQNKEVVNELRSNLKNANEEIDYLSHELEEFIAQNTILKDKMTETLEKNDDMAGVIAELSKYYIHIKKASAKSSELSKFLHEPDSNIEEKLEKYRDLDNEDNKEKKFF